MPRFYPARDTKSCNICYSQSCSEKGLVYNALVCQCYLIVECAVGKTICVMPTGCYAHRTMKPRSDKRPVTITARDGGDC